MGALTLQAAKDTLLAEFTYATGTLLQADAVARKTALAAVLSHPECMKWQIQLEAYAATLSS
jgi:hypothetical protein